MSKQVEAFSGDAAVALAIPSKRSLRRDEDLQKFNGLTDLVETDEEANSRSSLFDQFLKQGGSS